MFTLRLTLPYGDALRHYALLRQASPARPSFILESRSVSETYGRMSLVGTQPSLAIRLQQEEVTLEALTDTAQPMLAAVREAFYSFLCQETASSLRLRIPKGPAPVDEANRFQRQNAASVIPFLLKYFHQPEKSFAGFYGAMAYNFVFQYEDLVDLPADETPDAVLHFYDTILLYNHLTQECTLYCTQPTEAEAKAKAQAVVDQLHGDVLPTPTPVVSSVAIAPSAEVFQQQVREAIRLCEDGELLEIVFSRELTASLTGDPLQLYATYRDINPAPYLFFFDFVDEQLCGASPEMMVRVENGRVTLRPISGSAPRGANAVEDHHRMLALLNSEKEKSELDMLVDLGRNDLARVCKPGVRVDDYRVIEKYSAVMHTVAQVSGELAENYTGYDALVACLNAGTLTGAPKVAAMQHIAQIEAAPRGYYGGVVGYLHLTGEVNTGITIRTAHIRNGQLRYRAGATLLVECDPAAELREVALKMAAFERVLHHFQPQSHAVAV